MKLSIGLKVLFSVLLIDSIIFVISALLYERTMAETLEKEFESKGIAIVKALSSSVQGAILKGDTTLVQGAIDQYIAIHGVEYIYVDDDLGNVVAHTFTPYFPQEIKSQSTKDTRSLIDPSTGNVSKELKSSVVNYSEYDTMDLTYPILGGVLGHIHIGLGIGRQKHLIIVPIVMRALALSLTISIIGLIVISFSLNRILLPIKNLLVASKTLADDYHASIKVDTNGQDEVGQLARSFQLIVDKLQMHSRELEEKVSQRGRELTWPTRCWQTLHSFRP